MKKILIGLLLFLGFFLLYYSTLPNINTGFADSDEFIAIAKIHGVAHPSGYPLYTMLAIFVSKLPLPLSFAGRVNALSAILHAFTATLIFFVCKYLIEIYTDDRDISAISAFFGALALSISFSFWFFALFAEVFSLNNFLIALSLLFLLLWKKNKDDRMVLLTGFSFGLGLSNQQTFILLIPAFLFFLLFIDYNILFRWKILLVTIVCMVTGFALPYLYLPYAASQSPMINWENPQTFSAIIKSITRASYADSQGSGAYFSTKGISLTQRLLGLHLFFLYIINNLSWMYTALAMMGSLFLLLNKKYGLFIFLFLGIFGGGLFFSFYSPPIISINSLYELGINYRFYLASLIFFAILITFGIHALYVLAKRYLHRYDFMIYIVIFFLTMYVGINNFREIKKNDFGMGNRYAKALLTGLDKNALLICYTEQSCFTAPYMQMSEQVRPDVIIIPANFLQTPLEYIQKKYPKLIKTTMIRKNTNNSVALVQDLIRWNINKRPIYVAGISNLEVFSLKGNPFYLVPQGCAMKVSKTFQPLKETHACDSIQHEALNSFFTYRAPISQMFPLYLGFQRYYDYLQYFENGCVKLAKKAYKDALSLNPVVAVATRIPPDFSQKDMCGKNSPTLTVKDLLAKAKKNSVPTDKVLYYHEATLLKPDDIGLRLELAKLYEKIGEKEKAKIEYGDILIIDPKNKIAKNALR